jgi:hypothetical protein
MGECLSGAQAVHNCALFCARQTRRRRVKMKVQRILPFFKTVSL